MDELIKRQEQCNSMTDQELMTFHQLHKKLYMERSNHVKQLRFHTLTKTTRIINFKVVIHHLEIFHLQVTRILVLNTSTP